MRQTGTLIRIPEILPGCIEPFREKWQLQLQLLEVAENSAPAIDSFPVRQGARNICSSNSAPPVVWV